MIPSSFFDVEVSISIVEVVKDGLCALYAQAGGGQSRSFRFTYIEAIERIANFHFQHHRDRVYRQCFLHANVTRRLLTTSLIFFFFLCTSSFFHWINKKESQKSVGLECLGLVLFVTTTALMSSLHLFG